MRYEVKFGKVALTLDAADIVEAIQTASQDKNLPISACTSVKGVTVRYGRKTTDIWEFYDQGNIPVGTFYSKAAADKFSAECGTCAYVTKKRVKI